MTLTAVTLEAPVNSAVSEAVAAEARRGLTSSPKTLAPWLFYDEAGSRLFDQITTLPEYYLTRTERDLFTAHSEEIFTLLHEPGCPTSGISDVGKGQSANGNASHPALSIIELGAGTASKTGILLRALARIQPAVLYQPIDISDTALDEARVSIERSIPGVRVRPRVANYVTESITLERAPLTRVLALYIGSSIGNFSPVEARAILTRLRSGLRPGEALLLGTDFAPGPSKTVATLLAAYDDDAGVTAAFNRNVLHRLNRELGANFHPDRFAHRAHWNAAESRVEMHLESLPPQAVYIPDNAVGPALTLHFAPGETIHTENSYKFTPAAIGALLADSGFAVTRTFTAPQGLYAVTLAEAI